MARKWVKVFCTFDDDSLDLETNGAWFCLIKLAGLSPLDGTICITERLPYTQKQLAKVFNCSPRIASKVLQTLTGKGRIEVFPNGFLKLKNWEKYQSEYDRTKHYPSRKSTPKSTQESTPKSTPQNRIDIEEKRGNIFSLYEKTFGEMAPSGYSQEIACAEEDYPVWWVEDAFKVSLSKSKKSWPYVHAILKDWLKNGHGKQAEPVFHREIYEEL